MRRRCFLGGMMLATSFLMEGCDHSVNRPQELPLASDLPVAAVFKTMNGVPLQSGNDLLTVAPRTVIHLTGEIQANADVRLARFPQGFIVSTDLDVPPVPRPANWTDKYVDQPDDLHMIMLLSMSFSGGDRTQEQPIGDGYVNKLVDMGHKKAVFSGGILSPENPGEYVLRVWGSFKPEKECSSSKDRGAMGTPKLLKEFTLKVEETRETP